MKYKTNVYAIKRKTFIHRSKEFAVKYFLAFIQEISIFTRYRYIEKQKNYVFGRDKKEKIESIKKILRK